jgi:hypothetical protein
MKTLRSILVALLAKPPLWSGLLALTTLTGATPILPLALKAEKDEEESSPDGGVAAPQPRSRWLVLLKPILGSVILMTAIFVIQSSGTTPLIQPQVAYGVSCTADESSWLTTDYWQDAYTGNQTYATSHLINWQFNITRGGWCYAHHYATYNNWSTWVETSATSGGIVLQVTAGSDGHANSVIGQAIRYRSCTGANMTGTCTTGTPTGHMDNDLIIDTGKPSVWGNAPNTASHTVVVNSGASDATSNVYSTSGWISPDGGVTWWLCGTLGGSSGTFYCGVGSDGTYTVGVSAVDNAGNDSGRAWQSTVGVDATSPSKPSVTPTSTLFTSAQSGTVTWSASTDNYSGIYGYYVNYHWATLSNGSCVSQGGDSGWQWVGNTTSWGPTWGPGTCFQYQVVAEDNYGNWDQNSTSAWSAWIESDQGVPTFAGYVNSTCFVPGGTVSLTQNGSGDPAPSSSWNWGGGAYYYLNNWTSDSGWTNSTPWSYTVPTPSWGTQGTYQIEGTIRDNANNYQWSGYTYYVDNTAPSGAHVSGQPAYTKNSTIAFTPSATAGGCAGVSNVAISNDGSHWAYEGNINNALTNWDITNTTYGGNSAQGSHTVYVSFNEGGSGNWNQISFNVFYDTVAPALTWTYPTIATDLNSTASFNFTWTDSDTGGSGIATRTAKLFTGVASNNTCGAWNAGAAVSVTGSGPYAAASGVTATNSCYYLAVTLTDAASNSATFSSAAILVDTTAPTCALSYVTLTGTTSLTLSPLSSDAGSGVTQMSFNVDSYNYGWGTGTGWLPYATTYPYVLPTGDGYYILSANYRDAAGNSSSCYGPWTVLDTTAPNGSLNINSGASATKTVAVTLNPAATDPAATDGSKAGLKNMSVSNDGISWTTYTYATSKAWSLSGGDGTKTVFIKYSDAAGNWSSTYSHSILLDTIAPATTADCNNTTCTAWYPTPLSVTLAATDAGSGVASTHYTLDGGASTLYAGAITVSGDANHTITYWSLDAAGNLETTRTLHVGVDSTPPIVTWACTGTPGVGFQAHACTAGNWFIASPVAVTLSATDTLAPVTSFVYSIDGGSYNNYTGSFNVSGDGVHTILYIATNATNVANPALGRTGGAIYVDIDATAPAVSGILSPASPDGQNGWYIINSKHSAPTLSLSATDATSGPAGIFYTIDGGAATTYTGPINFADPKLTGTHTIVYWATDAASNASPTAGPGQTKVDPELPLLDFVANNYDPAHDTSIALVVSSHDLTSGTGNGSVSFSSDGGASWGDWLALDANGSYTGTMTVPAGNTLFAIEAKVRDLAGQISYPITGPAPITVLGGLPNLTLDLGISPRNSASDTCKRLPADISWSTTNTITWPTEQGFCLFERFDAANTGVVVGTDPVSGLKAVLLSLADYTTYQFLPLANSVYLSGPTDTARAQYFNPDGTLNGLSFTPVHETVGAGVSVSLTITTMVAWYSPDNIGPDNKPIDVNQVIKATNGVAFPVSGYVIVLNSGSLIGPAGSSTP